MREKIKNWFIFSITLVMSLIFLIWWFPVFWEELIYYLTFKKLIPRFSLFIAFPYFLGLFLGLILPIKFLQRWLFKFFSITLLLVCLLLFNLLAYLRSWQPLGSEPYFWHHVFGDIFVVVAFIYLIGLGLCLMGFIKIFKFRKK